MFDPDPDHDSNPAETRVQDDAPQSDAVAPQRGEADPAPNAPEGEADPAPNAPEGEADPAPSPNAPEGEDEAEPPAAERGGEAEEGEGDEADEQPADRGEDAVDEESPCVIAIVAAQGVFQSPSASLMAASVLLEGADADVPDGAVAVFVGPWKPFKSRRPPVLTGYLERARAGDLVEETVGTPAEGFARWLASQEQEGERAHRLTVDVVVWLPSAEEEEAWVAAVARVARRELLARPRHKLNRARWLARAARIDEHRALAVAALRAAGETDDEATAALALGVEELIPAATELLDREWSKASQPARPTQERPAKPPRPSTGERKPAKPAKPARKSPRARSR